MKSLFGMMGGLLAKKTHATFLEQGKAALQAGDLSEAQKCFTRALELAEPAKAHDCVAESSRHLGDIAERLDKLAVAEPHYRRAYQTHEDSEQFEDAAFCLILLGNLYQKQRRFPDAEQVLQYAMAIYQQQRGAHAPGIALAAACLGDCCLTGNKFSEAEKLFQRAIAIEEVLPDRQAALANDTYKLALALDGQKKEKEALSTFAQAVKLFAACPVQANAALAHEACACYHNYGKFLRARGKKDESKRFLEQAMQLAQEHPGYLDEANLVDLCASKAP